jgi:hypothetical protein
MFFVMLVVIMAAPAPLPTRLAPPTRPSLPGVAAGLGEALPPVSLLAICLRFLCWESSARCTCECGMVAGWRRNEPNDSTNYQVAGTHTSCGYGKAKGSCDPPGGRDQSEGGSVDLCVATESNFQFSSAIARRFFSTGWWSVAAAGSGAPESLT